MSPGLPGSGGQRRRLLRLRGSLASGRLRLPTGRVLRCALFAAALAAAFEAAQPGRGVALLSCELLSFCTFLMAAACFATFFAVALFCAVAASFAVFWICGRSTNAQSRARAPSRTQASPRSFGNSCSWNIVPSTTIGASPSGSMKTLNGSVFGRPQRNLRFGPDRDLRERRGARLRDDRRRREAEAELVVRVGRRERGVHARVAAVVERELVLAGQAPARRARQELGAGVEEEADLEHALGDGRVLGVLLRDDLQAERDRAGGGRRLPRRPEGELDLALGVGEQRELAGLELGPLRSVAEHLEGVLVDDLARVANLDEDTDLATRLGDQRGRRNSRRSAHPH